MPIRKKCKILLQSSVYHFRQNKRLISFFNNRESGILFRANTVDCHIPISNRNIYTSVQPQRMRFVQFTSNGGPRRLGVQLSQDNEDIIDISGVDHSIPNNLVQFLQGGPELIERAKRIVGEGKSVVSLKKASILSPVISPDKVICVGLNYSGHCDEQNIPYPKEPVFFSKFSSCIAGPYEEIPHPSVTTQLDWEVELAVVIGRKTKNVKSSRAMDHVFGYTVANDLSARDWQKSRNGGQFLLGKAMDKFCPLGPAVVMKEVLPDPHTLHICSRVNGCVKQDSNTSELIYKIDYIVSYLSHVLTLLPGDVILTGTPAGVGLHRKPSQFLKVGDVLESEIEGIGTLKNTIIGDENK